MRQRMGLALLIPLLAVLVIVGFAGGLGVIFIVIESTEAEVWGVVALGLVLLIGVPTVAHLLTQRTERQ